LKVSLAALLAETASLVNFLGVFCPPNEVFVIMFVALFVSSKVALLAR
jgi:hypothetical protein